MSLLVPAHDLVSLPIFHTVSYPTLGAIPLKNRAQWRRGSRAEEFESRPDIRRWFLQRIAPAALIALCLLGATFPASARTTATFGQTAVGENCANIEKAADFDTLAQCNAGTGAGTMQTAPLILGTVTSPPYADISCDSDKAGMIQYESSTMQYCNGSSWVSILASSGYLGTSASLTGPSRSDDVTTGLFSATASTVSIATAGTERLTVTATGSVGIGTTTPAYALDVSGRIQAQGGATFYSTAAQSVDFKNDSFTSTNKNFRIVQDQGGSITRFSNEGDSIHYMAFNMDTGYVGIATYPSYRLHVNGTAYATGAAGALSDIRHKDNIHDLAAGLEVVSKLRPVSFTWKEPSDSGMKGEQLGFIAQEVEEILPQVVLTQNDKDKTKGLKYTEFLPVLTKAVQELKEQNDTLRAAHEVDAKAIEELRNEIQALKVRLHESSSFKKASTYPE
ncbi:MAG: tail fiber domain-containing protein [Bdellovibrionales bacterium]